VCVFELTPQHAAKQTREEGVKKEGGNEGRWFSPMETLHFAGD